MDNSSYAPVAADQAGVGCTCSQSANAGGAGRPLTSRDLGGILFHPITVAWALHMFRKVRRRLKPAA